MGYLQLNRRYPIGFKGSRIQGFKRNAKELQRVEPIKRAHIKSVLFLTVEDPLQLAAGSSKSGKSHTNSV
jgi:hypothetical protein